MKKTQLKTELSFVGVIILLFVANGLYLSLKTELLYSHYQEIYRANEASKSTSLFGGGLGDNWSYLNLLLDKIDSTTAIHSYTPFIWIAILLIGLIVRQLSNSKLQNN